MTTPESTIEHLKEMAREAYKGGLNLKAARFFHQAGEIAEAHQDGRSRVNCLFWEGECLFEAGRCDEALPILMEAAASGSPEADPANVYAASITTINLCIMRKSVSFCRKFIEQTRSWLETSRKEEWKHLLDLLEGKLEFNRGDYEAAYHLYLNAWNVWREEYPSFTAASHLFWLCHAAFQRRNAPSLRKWVTAIEACKKNLEECKVKTNEARLLLFRAERTSYNDFSAAADLAVSTIDHQELFEGRTGEDFIPCSRILILAQRWLDVERTLANHPLGGSFNELMFLGDERFCRAREALGMEVRDDEYDTVFPDPPENIHKPKVGLQFLSEAAFFYERATDEAGKEDDRLETDHYTKILNERISRIKRLENAVTQRM